MFVAFGGGLTWERACGNWRALNNPAALLRAVHPHRQGRLSDPRGAARAYRRASQGRPKTLVEEFHITPATISHHIKGSPRRASSTTGARAKVHFASRSTPARPWPRSARTSPHSQFPASGPGRAPRRHSTAPRWCLPKPSRLTAARATRLSGQIRDPYRTLYGPNRPLDSPRRREYFDDHQTIASPPRGPGNPGAHPMAQETGRVAIITGGNRASASETGLQLARQGVTVLLGATSPRVRRPRRGSRRKASTSARPARRDGPGVDRRPQSVTSSAVRAPRHPREQRPGGRFVAGFRFQHRPGVGLARPSRPTCSASSRSRRRSCPAPQGGRAHREPLGILGSLAEHSDPASPIYRPRARVRRLEGRGEHVHRRTRAELKDTKIKVNAAPELVKTDMGGAGGPDGTHRRR